MKAYMDGLILERIKIKQKLIKSNKKLFAN